MKKTLLFSTLLAVSFTNAVADEGMWMLTDIKEQNAATMYELGLDIGIDSVYSPENISLKDAVVQFGGGCTGEVISPDGLVLTNHHCGYGAIQQHSSVEHDYLTDGFWAMSRSEELPCEGLTITYIDRILDVTDYVREQLKKDDDPDGLNYISPKYLETVAERFASEEGIELSPFTEVELKAFYGANKYYLFVKTVYKDIRMVGAPPSSIGKFGADTDNWEWPRHCGDFSMFRIYAAPDGKPAEYSTDNVPLKVKKHIPINISGIDEGDFTFVMGFPGRNWRYMISDEVKERMQITNFLRDTVRGVRLAAWNEEMMKDRKVKIQYASKYASVANYWKNAIGMNEWLKRLDVLSTKEQQQEELLEYGSATGNDSYLNAFNEIREIVANRHDAKFHQETILEALIMGTEFCGIPDTRELQDALERKDKDAVSKAVSKLRVMAPKFFNKDYDAAVDRKVSKLMLAVYENLIPAEQRISAFAVIGKKYKGDVSAFVDDCFDKSIFRSADAFNDFLDNPKLSVLRKDLMVMYSRSVKDAYAQLTVDMKAEDAGYAAAHKAWVAGMLELKKSKGQPVYPDANFSLRLTYGNISSYQPCDGATYLYYTTLDGVMEKEDPENPEFVVPARLKELYENRDFGPYAMKDGRMPVCFATGVDTTGGNSGSPVFNSRGELVGCGFDRNLEGLTGDIAYNPSLQRAAVVDIRYILFVIDKFAGAGHLIDEMTIVKN